VAHGFGGAVAVDLEQLLQAHNIGDVLPGSFHGECWIANTVVDLVQLIQAY
jgi:hypothetical protein